MRIYIIGNAIRVTRDHTMITAAEFFRRSLGRSICLKSAAAPPGRTCCRAVPEPRSGRRSAGCASPRAQLYRMV